MEEQINHNCGLCVAHTLHDTYSFLNSLQHRGREAAGIAAIGNNRIDAVKWIGNVGRLSRKAISNIFGRNTYHTYMGHVRYATHGNKDTQSLLSDAHPHVIGGQVTRNYNHEIILNCEAAIVHNGHIQSKFFEDLKGYFKTNCDSEKLLYYFYENGEKNTLTQIPLAYTAAFADKRRKGVVVLRDRTGIRPGILGIKDNKHCMASEDIALIENGGQSLENLTPGAAYYFDPEGNVEKKIMVPMIRKHCIFGPNYIQGDNSTVDGINVRTHKTNLGLKLAEEIPPNFDFVTYLPESPEIAARSYSSASGVPFISVFYKMRNERSFQGSTIKKRANSITNNLHLSPHAKKQITGKRGLLIDDSMVRGNNIKRARELLYEEAKVKEVTYALYTPPIGIIGEDGIPRGCIHGVDMPPNDNFIARNKTLEEISEEIKMPVHYLSIESLLEVFENEGYPKEELCYTCIGGPIILEELGTKYS